MKILLLVDPESIFEEDPQFEGKHEPSFTEVEFHVAESLRHLGHEIYALPFSADIEQTLRQISEHKPDLIFNLTEHYRGRRNMDVHITAVLDMLQIPYTGSGPMGLMLCRDKAVCKRILSHHRVKVPNFVSLRPGITRIKRKLNYPIIVKPVAEDGSDGISLSSLVNNEQELKERAAQVHERMHQPVICEEFIEGRELYVGIIGNKRLQALPAREIRFGDQNGTGPLFATAKVKRDEAYREKWNIRYTHAGLSPELEKRVGSVSKRIYRLLHLRDYGRIDLRLTPNGDMYFLEANPNPDLSVGDEVAESAEKAGMSYDQLIDFITHQALRRHAGS